MRGTLYGQLPEVSHRQGRRAMREQPGSVLSTEHGEHLEVHQLGRGQGFAAKSGPRSVPIDTVVGGAIWRRGAPRRDRQSSQGGCAHPCSTTGARTQRGPTKEEGQAGASANRR